MAYDCVLVDCSGSMGATGKSGKTRTQETLDILFDMLIGKGPHGKLGYLDRKTLIIPFDDAPRGGITLGLLEQMSRAEVEKIFAPAGGTNIPRAIYFAGSTNTLILTDSPTETFTMGANAIFPIIDIS